MPGSTARLTAVETLFQLEKTRKPVSSLFDTVADRYRTDARDRQLAMKIIYGVLRNRDYLNLLLDILCSRPPGKIKPFVRQALFSGLYQIFFLDRIPNSAAVNETVAVVKSRNLPKQVQGFVNGVLRQSIRRKQALPAPHDRDAHGRPILNHPAWLVDRWRDRFGEAAMIEICHRNNLEPVLGLRAKSAVAKQQFLGELAARNLTGKSGRYAPNSVLLDNYTGPVTDLPGHEDGLVRVQDQAAQLATMLLAPFKGGHRFLDACAGLGGKTSHIIELLGPDNLRLTAVEPDRRRYRCLEDATAPVLHSTGLELVNRTLQEFSATGDKHFERILLDAPCSGTGVIGRHPDIRWNRLQSELADYPSRQLELLSAAAGMTVPGGIIVYATCSIEPEENEMVVGRFLRGNPDFSRSDCRPFLPASCMPLVRNGFFAPLPDYGIDGFFAARLVKRGKN